MTRPRLLSSGLLALALTLPAGAARAQGDDIGEKVYQKGLRSTVFIAVRLGGSRFTMGSGSLIDAQQRLVLTNYHIVRDWPEVMVQFPMYEKGSDRKPELVVDRKRYLEALATSAPIRGKSLFADPGRDLVILQLERLPPGTPALRLAAASPSPGQRVHSIGNPAVSDALWVYTPGNVRAVYRRQMHAADSRGRFSFDIDAHIIETTSAVNAGDSGGPLLNDKCELVGVTQGHAAEEDARAVSYFIDIREVHDLLAAKRVRLSTPPTAVLANAEGTIPKPAAKPPSEAEANFALAAAKSVLADGKRDRARERLEDLVRQYPDSKAAAEAKQLLDKLK